MWGINKTYEDYAVAFLIVVGNSEPKKIAQERVW